MTEYLKLAASFAYDRLKEPSTYAGLAAMLVAWHIPGAPLWAQMLVAAAGAGAAVIKEKGTDAFK